MPELSKQFVMICMAKTWILVTSILFSTATRIKHEQTLQIVKLSIESYIEKFLKYGTVNICRTLSYEF